MVCHDCARSTQGKKGASLFNQLKDSAHNAKPHHVFLWTLTFYDTQNVGAWYSTNEEMWATDLMPKAMRLSYIYHFSTIIWVFRMYTQSFLMFSDMLHCDFGSLTTFGCDGKGDSWSEWMVWVFLWQIVLLSNDSHSYISSFGKIKILQNLLMGTVLRVYLLP